jgi:hypothetical protein
MTTDEMLQAAEKLQTLGAKLRTLGKWKSVCLEWSPVVNSIVKELSNDAQAIPDTDLRASAAKFLCNGFGEWQKQIAKEMREVAVAMSDCKSPPEQGDLDLSVVKQLCQIVENGANIAEGEPGKLEWTKILKNRDMLFARSSYGGEVVDYDIDHVIDPSGKESFVARKHVNGLASQILGIKNTCDEAMVVCQNDADAWKGGEERND